MDSQAAKPQRRDGAPLSRRLAATATVGAAPLLAWAFAALTWDTVAGLVREAERAPSLALMTTTLTDALAVLAGATGAIVASHLSLTSVLLLATPRHSRLRRATARVTPRPWRRVVAIAATGAMSAGLALPAAAAPSTSDAGWLSEPVTATVAAAPDTTTALGATGGADVGHQSAAASGNEPAHSAPAPTTAGAPHHSSEDVRSSSEQTPGPYVVEIGDSLWSITAEALYDGAVSGSHRPAAPDVAAAWPELYEENREAIGEDPALIHPGTELRIPEGWAR